MSFLRLVWQSFSYYFKRNILVIIGVALSTAVLTGALFIGDSLHYSLQQITLSRLGRITHLITVNDRYFRSELADEIAGEIGIPVAPVMILDGMAVADGGLKRVNNIQITGTDLRFEAVSGSAVYNNLSGNEIIISANLAQKLDVRAGDALLIRIARASLMPANAPFMSEKENTIALRATIRYVASGSQMGSFNLKNSQMATYNVFMSLDEMNRIMGMEGRANRLLIAGETNPEKITNALDHHLQPLDAGLICRTIPTTGESEISSERVFIEDKVTQTFRNEPGSRIIMTWFFNQLGFRGKEVPYSFAASWPGAGLSFNDIIVNEWVADDLRIKRGDSLRMTFFAIGPLRQLTEKSTNLVVKKIVPLSGVFADKDLTPRIPGLFDAGHCREWEAGVPIHLDKIRQKDEDYWNHYKGTPKAFVSPMLADSLWSNRFGSCTAIRFPSGEFSEEKFIQIFRDKFRSADFGFNVQQVRQNGLKAAREGVDFGQLFLGLSFFLLLSAIILTSMLFRLNLENRISQVGTLLQLGFSKKQVSRIILAEAMAIAIAGVLSGLVLAIVYVRVIFTFLNSLWWDIVRTSVILLKVDITTLLLGAFLSLIVSLVSVSIPMQQFLSRTIISLHQKKEALPNFGPEKMQKTVVPLFFIAALIPVFIGLIRGKALEPGLFFMSGGLLLAGFLLLTMLILPKTEFYHKNRLNIKNLGLRMISRNRRRSFAIVILFALGTFLVISIGTNQNDILPGTQDKLSGTGGFSHYAETSAPVLFDLNDPGRRLAEGLDSSFRVVQLNEIGGDDASCLNLNRVENPAILGIDAENLEGRFSFNTHTNDLDVANPWSSLKKTLAGGVVPAVADQTVIQWGLGMKVGDTLIYRAETGESLRLKLIGGLAPSIFQGRVLIDNSFFFRYYPSHSGSSVFLIESNPGTGETIAAELQNLLRDNGFEITLASERLAEFHSITNTYLSIFLALGILGLALGTIGLSVILARTIIERRREMAVMSAIGFPKRNIAGQLITEYALLLVCGVGIGFLSAFTPLLPGLVYEGNSISGWHILALVSFIILNGLVWISGLAVVLIKAKNLLPSLKND